MRYTAEQIRPGITHDLQMVRGECLRYFTGGRRENRRVMPEVIRAVEKFGRTDAFPYVHMIRDAVPTEDTIGWVVEELNRPHGGTDKRRQYVRTLSGMLNNVEVAVLRQRESEILAARGLEEKDAEQLRRRLSLAERDGETLWQNLEELCERNNDTFYIDKFPYQEALDIVEALALQGDAHADRVMELLAREPDQDDEADPFWWVELFVIELAGWMHLEPAIPVLMDKFLRDEEGVNEACLRALVEIGTDAVVEAVRVKFTDPEWPGRHYAAGILEEIHTDRSVEVGLELLELSQDAEEYIQENLLWGLVGHFSTEGLDKARAWMLEGPTYDLLSMLVPVSIFMGRDFPELARWREQVERQHQRSQKLIRASGLLDAPRPAREFRDDEPELSPVSPVRKEVAAGRNDPCPCGSGKKYKKCCMRKADAP